MCRENAKGTSQSASIIVLLQARENKVAGWSGAARQNSSVGTDVLVMEHFSDSHRCDIDNVTSVIPPVQPQQTSGSTT